MDTTYKTDLRDLIEVQAQRFVARLEQRLAETRADLRTKMHSSFAQLRTEMSALAGELRTEMPAGYQAEGMLQWPHSGCHVHAGVGVSAADRPFALRLARYCARNPLALDGPTAGTAALDPLEFLSRSGDDALLRLVRQPDPWDPSASGL